jgi:peptide deformylase
VAVREIRVLGDPALTTPCPPVTRFDDRLRRLVDDLMETVDAPGRAGLAAPQIGVSARVFSYLVDDLHGYVINPELVDPSAEEQEDLEGCLSVPDLAFPLARPARITVRGVDLTGRSVEVTGEGLLARCFQHEVDHLDGTLYLDRLPRGTRRRAMREVREAEWFGAGQPRTPLLGR